jgi:Putative auto-transporter adhesin, head GIN domain
MQQRPRLRKREIAFAIAAGGMAAGAAALILSDGGPGTELAPITVTEAPRTFEVGEFTEISTVGPQNLVVTRGDGFSVRSEGDPGALGLLEVVNDDGELVIRPKNQFGPNFNWGRMSGATYFVTLPRLEEISMAGSGSVQIDRVEGEEFSGSIAGSGELRIAALDVDEADFSIGGSGNLSVVGSAREAEISIGGSGEVNADGLIAESASIRIGGSGNVALTARDEVDVSIAGSGEVNISGPAQCSVSRMGSGNVRCEGGGGTDD